MTLYYAGEAWNHFERLFQDRLPYLIIYISLGAMISLILSYRMGPPTNVKTLNIIRWSLQVSVSRIDCQYYFILSLHLIFIIIFTALRIGTYPPKQWSDRIFNMHHRFSGRLQVNCSQSARSSNEVQVCISILIFYAVMTIPTPDRNEYLFYFLHSFPYILS